MSSGGWLELLAVAGHGGRAWLEALVQAGDPDTLLSMNARGLARLKLSRDVRARLGERRADVPGAWHDWLAEPGHRLLPYGSAHYPERLAELPDAPLALWADGAEADVLHDPQLAIVGSRHPTRSGRALAESFASALSAAGLTVTSGLALGIDAAGHRGALQGQGGTIAVLGNGIDRIYPADNRGLAEQVRAHGLIVSEYPPATPVRAFQFPRRNRIIAGLSLGTLVVEATRRSGSLITARLAAEQGREVFAIPGSIASPMSKGCHKLLREGATLAEDTNDILAEIAPQLRAAAHDSPAARGSDETDSLPPKLKDCLGFSPISFDALVAATGLTAAELSSMLLHLEIQGKVEALPGGRFCRLIKRA